MRDGFAAGIEVGHGWIGDGHDECLWDSWETAEIRFLRFFHKISENFVSYGAENSELLFYPHFLLLFLLSSLSIPNITWHDRISARASSPYTPLVLQLTRVSFNSRLCGNDPSACETHYVCCLSTSKMVWLHTDTNNRVRVHCSTYADSQISYPENLPKVTIIISFNHQIKPSGPASQFSLNNTPSLRN